jgi:general L-amino acid transport system ATP-binding protein
MILAEDVKKWFGRFQALKGISMSLKKAETMVIVGPSGSGKSTFIRTINRLERHDAGRIVVDGIELTDDVRNIAQVRSEIGMVFQSFNLFPHLTIVQNITLAPRNVHRWPKKKAEQKAMQLLERVGIPEQAHKYPAQLSGGQQQRVAIARALAMEELAGSGMTMIVVTHEIGFARHVADRVVLFDDGVLVEEAAPDEFFDHPQHERTKRFLAQIL